MIKGIFKKKEWNNSKELFLKKKEIRARLENVLDTIQSKEILEDKDINIVRNEINNINSIKMKSNRIQRKEIGQFIQSETSKLLNEKLDGESIDYKKYIIDTLELFI